MSAPHGRPSFLLLHGGYHKPTCWSLLQAELAERGWLSLAISMPSAGEQRTPSAGLYDDANELAAHLRRIKGPVIVVGHSHSGLTISQLGNDHPNLVRLVYISAFMPIEGESAATASGISVPDEAVGGLAPALHNPRTSLYGDLSDDEAARAIDELVQQSMRSCVEPTTRAAWRKTPSSYVICGQDRLFPVALQEQYAAQATDVHRLPTGHSPFLSAPGRLATLLIEIATT